MAPKSLFIDISLISNFLGIRKATFRDPFQKQLTKVASVWSQMNTKLVKLTQLAFLPKNDIKQISVIATFFYYKMT